MGIVQRQCQMHFKHTNTYFRFEVSQILNTNKTSNEQILWNHSLVALVFIGSCAYTNNNDREKQNKLQ